ncbi:MAG: sporulation transcriptional regulator SpoIIID [Oscillospiraceae bacterium]|jgi:putative DeoR family transcriptional regulator (stage III sporulation protein D)|nr:sporulation transcriptional regulator SpoIIID [Oscillospiraceae bacterium]
MREDIELRVLKVGEYIAETGATVREAAKAFGVSKSTVHKDVGERLAWVDRGLYADVCRVLAQNKAERHLRGGYATREKYKCVERKKKIGNK